MLIFSQFTSMLELIAQDLLDAGISYFVITGATPKEERMKLVKRFNNDDTPVFLISLKAGGTGLNLVGADIVIHYDPWWNLAVQNQATDRAHRIGQTRVVSVFKLIAKGTIEERIVEMQETKKDLADEILNSENGTLGKMTKEELLALLT
jgi:SNF2 family DNA or RNA helicase